MKSPSSSEKKKCISRIIDKYPKLLNFLRKYKLLITIILGIVSILTFTFFFIASDKSEQNKKEEIKDGSSLKAGDYIQFGSYQVEREGFSPLLWIVIDENDHYAGDVNPDIGHLTLLTADIIDLRGFDAIEPQNANDIRRGFGNNRYRTSNLRQWLNSDKNANQWWQPQNLDDAKNNADSPPSDQGFPDFSRLGYEDKEGFLKGFSVDEKEAVLETKITVGKNTVTEGGGQENVTDKVFLLSLAEAGFEGLGGALEGKPFSIFKNDPSRLASKITQQCATNSKSEDKPSSSKNWPWWLRSPSTGFPASVFVVSDSGSALYSPATMPEGSIGVRPALNLKKSFIFSGAGTKDNPYIISAQSEDVAVKHSQAVDNQSKKMQAEEKAVIVSDNDQLLKNACQIATTDYPKEDVNLKSLVAWADSDETFYIRTSPDSSIWKVESPARDGYKLIDLGFIDKQTLGFTLDNSGKQFKIGVMDVEFENSGTIFKGSKSSIKYENKGEILDVSYLGKDDFVTLNKSGEKISLKHKETLLYQTDYSNAGSYRLGKSPNNLFVYLISGNDLLVFDLSKNLKIEEIKGVLSAVWVGNLNLLCSGKDAVILYSLKGKTSTKIETIKTGDLGFCPRNGGTIISSKNSKAYAVSCSTFAELNSVSNAFFEALADSNTAIATKYKSDGSTEEVVYWRFVTGGWGLHLSSGMYHHDNKPVFATLWSNY